MRQGRHGGWVVLATAFQWRFAVAEMETTLAVTAVYLAWIRCEGRADTREIALALLLGTLIAAAAVGFLFL
ncbi:hypothetical protein [Nonomuraea sp. NPDC023979]|uniref:hypothetical protein n=1 Tax=Nonomuraea sp. NPDC023979 TaxID=3154796 RepID=UPI0033CF953B